MDARAHWAGNSSGYFISNEFYLNNKIIQWYEFWKGVSVQSAEKGTEKRHGKFHLDGFVERDGQKDLAIEVMGLVFMITLYFTGNWEYIILVTEILVTSYTTCS